MAQKQLYQIAVWYRDGKDSDKDKLVTEPKTVEAHDTKHAERIALVALPAEYAEKLDKIEVQVRPF